MVGFLSFLPSNLHAQRPGSASQMPMPVPAAVAISRPTDDEIAVAKSSLGKLLDQAEPAAKEVFKKYPDLVTVQPPRTNPCIVPWLNPGFRQKHTANVEAAGKGDIKLLFMGDSITDWWWRSGPEGVSNPASSGRAVFDKYFRDMKVGNFGIAGDTTQGVLYRLNDGEGTGFKPNGIMLMIGTNNIDGRTSASEIAEGVGAVVLKMRDSFPEAKILLLAIFPRGNPGDDMRKVVDNVNPRIAKLHDGQHVFYLNINDKFLAPDGTIPREIMGDKLHPTEKGYEIWAEAVKAPLAKLME